MATSILFEIGRVFTFFNARLFGGLLQVPEIVIARTKRGVVKFVPEDFCLTIGGDVGRVNAEAFLVHLLHEMVHIYNFQHGVVDCRLGQYHNVKFRNAALRVGLTVSQDKSHGWGLTTIEERGMETATKKYPTVEDDTKREKSFRDVHLSRDVFAKLQSKTKTKRLYFLKYECACPAPHNSIRSGRRPDGEHPLSIQCLVCNTAFRCVSVLKK